MANIYSKVPPSIGNPPKSTPVLVTNKVLSPISKTSLLFVSSIK